MKWTIFSLACAALLTSAGCCCSKACGPCGTSGYGYGATYAPSYAPSTCPGGNCGPMYPSGAVIPGAQQAYVPYTTTASLDYLPAY
ncbi:hypothetical protein SH661x_000818 [Planctomicrobium sp. SH661]|uniref:hypothetical protein n=1 Tax=Planctomicrobium sp. SH661 TaxID=3448124 RepID=UPI003F5C2615